ncbi:MAG: hypothetical protein JW803_08820 [Endomicrobiales bacterium]|nr:hypothetical protein [Endomicrobiales bacterium]
MDPSTIKATSIKAGKEYQVLVSTDSGGYFLKVFNAGKTDSKYKVTLMSCKEYGCDPYIGYEEIPDTKWLEVAEPDLSVPAGKTGYFKGVSVKVPKSKKYYGKKYQAVVKVTEESVAGRTMNVEVVLPLWLEVEKKK